MFFKLRKIKMTDKPQNFAILMYLMIFIFGDVLLICNKIIKNTNDHVS